MLFPFLRPGLPEPEAWVHYLKTPYEQRGETITVLVQAAVFSALLALYLHNIKRDLDLPGRLYYYDLGQALDLVSPDVGGWWVQKSRAASEAGDLSLPFELST